MNSQNSSKLLYRLDSRNKTTLFIACTPILLLLIFPTSFMLFSDGAKLVIGVVLATVLLYNLFDKLNFRYVEIYDDKIIIAKLLKEIRLAKDEVVSCHFKSFPFMPYKVDIIVKQDGDKSKFYSIDGLNFSQSKRICWFVLSSGSEHKFSL